MMCKRLIYVMLFVLGLAAASGRAALVHHWKLDDTGTTAVDSASGLDGVIKGTPLSVEGKVGKALKFDGQDDVVEIANFKTPQKATVVFWINSPLTMTTAMQRVFGTGGNYETWINNAGDIANELTDNGSYGVMAMGVLKANEWAHVVQTYDNATAAMEIYVNGILSVAKNAQTPSFPAGGTLLIGHRSGGAADQRFAGLMDDVQIYDEVLRAKQIRSLYGSQIAENPFPADESTDVPRDVTLSWVAGETAIAHDVYLGTSFNDVNDAGRGAPLGVLVSQGQDATAYDPSADLGFSRTWYWRVDEVNAPPGNTVFKGDVWSFTTEAYTYSVKNILATSNGVSEAGEGPENVVNGSGLNAADQHSTAKTDMWMAAANDPLWIRFEFDRIYKLHELLVWNHNGEFEKFLGFGLKNVNIEHSTDGTEWTAFGAATFAQATANAAYSSYTTIPLAGMVAKYVRFNIVSGYGTSGSYGLSEIRFSYIPTFAREPQPASGATNVALDTVLSWRAGREAVSHDVYLSTDKQAVIDGTTAAATVTTARFDPALQIDRTYYWKVDEVNAAESAGAGQGSVWSFSTPPFAPVDDFEAYTETEGDRIYQAWVDGYGTTTNGSQVGYVEGPFVEKTIIHGGRQSMPLLYDNTTVALSEATRIFDDARDWAAWGAKTLVVFFYGDPASTAGQLYVKVNNQKTVYPDTAALKQPLWQQWNIDLASLGTNLQSVTKVTVGIEGAGAKGTLFVDDIRLYVSAPAVKEQIWIEAEAATTITAPLEAADRADASAGRYIGSVDAGLSRSAGPGTDGTGLATYKFTVQGGVYTVRVREIIATGQTDSWWVRIQGATLNVKTHTSGWIQWNGVPISPNWAWNTIYSSDDGGKTVLFTLPAGTYTLEMAYREDGCLLDALVIAAQ